MSIPAWPTEPGEARGSRWEGVSAYSWLSRSAATRHPARNSAAALLLITMIAVLYPFEYDTGRTNYSLGDAVVGPIAVWFILRALARPLRWPRYTIHVLSLIVVAIASTLVNAFAPESFFSASGALLETSKLLSASLWMCVIFWLLSEDFPRRFLQLACSSAALAAAFAVSSLWVTAREATDYRPTGPFDNTNLYASFLCLNVFLVLGTGEVLHDCRLMHRPLPTVLRRIGPLLAPVTLPLLFLGLVATGSRGAIVGCVAGLILSGRWRPRRMPPIRLAAVAAGLLLLVAVGGWYVRQHPLVFKRLETTAEGSGPNIENRFELWQAGREALAAHPVFGVGYGQLRNYVELVYGENKPVHETFLSIAAELGVVGLGVFIWLIGAAMRDTAPARCGRYPDVARACRGFLIAILTQGLFTNVQHSRALWMILGVVAVQVAQGASAGSGSGTRPPVPAWPLRWRRPMVPDGRARL